MFEGTPIAVWDSGIGGFSVLPHLTAQLPGEQFLYIADQAHIPYGTLSLAALCRLGTAVTQFALQAGAKMMVIACNTASAAALDFLRAQFPTVPFVGMEPAIKPAVLRTRRGVIGILATAVTFQSARYLRLKARFARDVTVIEDPCTGLVEQIEAGLLEAPETRANLKRILQPMLAAEIDYLVLGCTHYPFVRPLIAELTGSDVTIVDPAPAIGRQAATLLHQYDLNSPHVLPTIRCITTGDAAQFATQTERFLSMPCRIETAVWQHSRLIPAT